MEKLDGQSMDIVSENISKLKEIFPDVFSEGKVDFEALEATLGEYVDGKEERYSFNWNGKAKARRIAQTPSTGTLRPAKEESKDWDSTENLYIEGDNLEALKLLQKSYHKQVKMIYVDPPYNTGKDFVYKDSFKDNIKNYLQQTGQVDSEGNKLSTNSDTSGRYHSDWLNMMYPRLKLARNLLKDDGVIFISIDDNEVVNLRKICDDIFGEENFAAQFVWNTEGNTDNQYEIKVNHEYIVAYYKNSLHSKIAIGYVVDPNTPEESNLLKGYADNNINKNSTANPPSIIELPAGFPSSEEKLFYKAKKVDEDFFQSAYKDKYISDQLKNKYSIEANSGLPVKLDDMKVENFELLKPCNIFVGVANKNKLLEFINNGCEAIIDDDGFPIKFYINANAAVRYRKERDKARNILSVLRNLGTTEKNKTALKRNGIYFDYPKPYELIKYIVQVGCEQQNGIILDFFAGSGTTAHAVMKQNAEDGGNRHCISIQLPEPTNEKSEAYKANYKNISDISKERIRYAAKKIKEENPTCNTDLGFKVFKLDSSNIKTWDPESENLEQSLFEAVNNIKSDRTEEDLLYEILLKYGLALTLPIEELKLAGKKVYIVGLGALVICLDEQITLDTVEEIAKLKEQYESDDLMRVVFRDNGFKDAEVKTNAIQILKQSGIDDVKSL